MEEKNKKCCVIGTIGQSGHGKTWLTKAIIKVASLSKDQNQLYNLNDDVTESKDVEKHTIHFEYEMDNVQYSHFDCSGSTRDIVKYLPSMDVAILVVSAADGPMPETREHVLLARQFGIENIVVFINKADQVNNEKMIDQVEMNIKALLYDYYFSEEDILIVKGSALKVLECPSLDLSSPEYEPIKELLINLSNIEGGLH